MSLPPDVTLADEPLAGRMLRLASPSYAVNYPEIEHREGIPRDVLRAMEQSFTRGRMPVRPVTFYHLKDVFVCAEGLVFDRDYRLFRSTLTQHPPRQVAEALQTLRARRSSGNVPTHAGPVLLCKKIGSFNYGHWMLEMLPRVLLARENLGITGLRFLVHELEGPMRGVIAESLHIAGVAAKDVLRTGNEPHFFSDLIIVDGLSEHGLYMSPLCVATLERFAARVRTGPSERIFVTRRSARWRRFRNEEQLHDIAQRAGYSLVDPGEMPVAQQIMVFKGARRIAGITGAGVSNIAFSAPGAAARLFVPRSMPDTFFWLISQIRGHAYAEMRCAEVGMPPVDSVVHPSWNCDITISPPEFRRFIEA
jgi:capsular polysaccharide biosynthesis protein